MSGEKTLELAKNRTQLKKKIQIKKNFMKNVPFLLMIIPGVLFLLIFNYLPMAGVVIAFRNINFMAGFFGDKWVGFKNFEYLFTSPDAFIITRNTVLYNLTFIIIDLVLALFLAIALNELKNKLAAKFYQTVMFLPYFLSWVVISYIVYAFLQIDHGFINKSILEPLHIKGVDWYISPQYWPFILVFLNAWKVSGYNSVIYLAAITGIEQELYEAASIDGANKWQQITKITIPSISPVIIILLILAVGKIFNADFGLFYQTTLDSGALLSTTNVINTYVYRGLKSTGDIGMSAAAGLYQATVGFIMVLITNTIVKKIDDSKSLF